MDLLFTGILACFLLAGTVESHPDKLGRKRECRDVGSPLILTAFIEANQLPTARKLSVVNFPGDRAYQSYSGFLTVNKTHNSNMFFWFFPGEVRDPSSLPVLLSLSGGPGTSSIFGLFNENGRYVIDRRGRVELREYRWTRQANMLYIDNPIGAGFSHTNNTAGYSKTQEEYGENLYAVLQQFFQLFPEFSTGKFYMNGISYAAKYVSVLGRIIHERNILSSFKIPLEGVAIESGIPDPANQAHFGELLFNLGLLSHLELDTFRMYEDRFRAAISVKDWTAAYGIFNEVLYGSDQSPSLLYNTTGLKNPYNFLQTEEPAYLYLYQKLMEDCAIRKALHVGSLEFSNGSMAAKFLVEEVPQSVVDSLKIVLENYRVMIYNGQLDIISGPVLSERYLNALNWDGRDGFLSAEKTIWKVRKTDSEVAAVLRTSGNFTYAVVRNAGHELAHNAPRSAFNLMELFLQNQLSLIK